MSELEGDTQPGSVAVVALGYPSAERGCIVCLRIDESGVAVETEDASASRNGFERKVDWSGGDVWVSGGGRGDTEEGESSERDEDLGELHGSSCVACQSSLTLPSSFYNTLAGALLNTCTGSSRCQGGPEWA